MNNNNSVNLNTTDLINHKLLPADEFGIKLRQFYQIVLLERALNNKFIELTCTENRIFVFPNNIPFVPIRVVTLNKEEGICHTSVFKTARWTKVSGFVESITKFLNGHMHINFSFGFRILNNIYPKESNNNFTNETNEIDNLNDSNSSNVNDSNEINNTNKFNLNDLNKSIFESVRFFQPHHSDFTVEQFINYHTNFEFVCLLHLSIVFVSNALKPRRYKNEVYYNHEVAEENQYFKLVAPIDAKIKHVRIELLKQLKNQGIILPTISLYQAEFKTSTRIHIKSSSLLEDEDDVLYYFNSSILTLMAFYNFEAPVLNEHKKEEEDELNKNKEIELNKNKENEIEEIERKCDITNHDINQVLCRSRTIKIEFKQSDFLKYNFKFPFNHNETFNINLLLYPFQSLQYVITYLARTYHLPENQIYLQSKDQLSELISLENQTSTTSSNTFGPASDILFHQDLISKYTTFLSLDIPNGATLQLRAQPTLNPLYIPSINNKSVLRRQYIDDDNLFLIPQLYLIKHNDGKEVQLAVQFWDTLELILLVHGDITNLDKIKRSIDVQEIDSLLQELSECLFNLHQELYMTPMTTKDAIEGLQTIRTITDFMKATEQSYMTNDNYINNNNFNYINNNNINDINNNNINNINNNDNPYQYSSDDDNNIESDITRQNMNHLHNFNNNSNMNHLHNFNNNPNMNHLPDYDEGTEFDHLIPPSQLYRDTSSSDCNLYIDEDKEYLAQLNDNTSNNFNNIQKRHFNDLETLASVSQMTNTDEYVNFNIKRRKYE